MTLRNIVFGMLLMGGIPLMAMDATTGTDDRVTFACDWCQGQKIVLNSSSAAAPYSGIDCRHLLCDGCTTQLVEKYFMNPDPRFYWCYRCWAFYHEKKKVCWFPIHERSSGLASTGVGATAFKQEFGGTVRNLPGVDANTVIPANPDLQPDTNSGWLKLPSFKIKIPGNKGLFGGCISLAIIVLAYVAYKKYWAQNEEDNEEGEEEQKDNQNGKNDEVIS